MNRIRTTEQTVLSVLDDRTMSKEFVDVLKNDRELINSMMDSLQVYFDKEIAEGRYDVSSVAEHLRSAGWNAEEAISYTLAYFITYIVSDGISDTDKQERKVSEYLKEGLTISAEMHAPE